MEVSRIALESKLIELSELQILRKQGVKALNVKVIMCEPD
jgi:hypothetical protein